VPFLPRVSFDSVQALAKGYLLPERLHSAHDGLSPIHRDRLTRKEAYRCGVMGPLLRDEFEGCLEREGVSVLRGPVEVDLTGEARRLEAAPGGDGAGEEDGGAAAQTTTTARVALISHIGGHKFAGNVIVYVPPGQRLEDGSAHPLAGYGIWYGRVEPRHVEGLVRETVLRGRVVEDMFRGGIDAQRRILRL